MNTWSPSLLNLLNHLHDGTCHSGTKLGEALGISRSAIWKQINQLIEAGVPIIRVPHKGYQLTNPFIFLSEQQIRDCLQANQFPQPFNVHLFNSIDSTNRFLKELTVSNQLDICCAEIQTQGRGRFGRHWHSPFGENIYCSSRWNLNCDLSSLSGLSLVSSLAVLAALKEITSIPQIQIKWPNDILWGTKKLSGSLIEVMAESNGNIQVIIGIGLNVNSDTAQQPLNDIPWCSLFEITQKTYDRNQLIARIILHLERYLSRFVQEGLEPFINDWNDCDYLKGKYSTVTQASGSISGIACGINQAGLLILKDDKGTLHYIGSGDASLRAGGENSSRAF